MEMAARWLSSPGHAGFLVFYRDYMTRFRISLNQHLKKREQEMNYQ